MADITVTVSNTNLFSITNNEATNTNFYIERPICKGNSITYSNSQSDTTPFPNVLLDPDEVSTFQFLEDGLYRLTVTSGDDEEYYVRATGNIEACERALIQEIYCGEDDCDKYSYNQRLSKLMVFLSYKDRLYALLNSYQQDQSISSLISIPEAERLTVCQYFCILKDMCGTCINTITYDTVVTDCGCNK